LILLINPALCFTGNTIAMSFFKRNKDAPLIPPVAAPPQAKPDPYASNGSNRGGGGGGGDPYARSKPAAGAGAGVGGSADPYARNAVGPDDAARNELFSGYSGPEKVEPTRKYGYEGREMEEDFDEDEEVEGIKQEMRGLKQESLASTRWVKQGRD
jgi:hypothetical protein